VKREMRSRIPHCELKWEIPIKKRLVETAGGGAGSQKNLKEVDKDE